LNLKQYAESKYLSPSTITKYIKANEKRFAGLLIKRGNSLELSDEAVSLLNVHFSKPIEDSVPSAVMSELSDLRQQLLKAQEKIIQLQEEQRENITLIATAQAQKLLAETTQAELNQRNRELLEEQGKVSALETKTATMQELIDFQTKALEMSQKGQSEAEERLQNAEIENKTLKSENESRKAEAEELQAELQKIKNRGFWARVFNR